MIRASSAGNPWHDGNGKFCSKADASLIKYNDKFFNCANKTVKEKEAMLQKIKADSKASYYDKQTSNRYSNAAKVSTVQFNNESEKEFQAKYVAAYNAFVKENAYHINNGGDVLQYVDTEKSTINFVCINSEKIVNDTMKNAGASIDISTCTKPFGGYMVAKHPEASTWIDCNVSKRELTNKIHDYCRKHLKELVNENVYIGTWFDPQSRKISLDISERIDSLKTAKKLGTERNEKAIWDVKCSNAIDTGGTGNNI